MTSKKQQKGFTLIELLVVIAIIGILSSVVLASMNHARKKARDARRQSDLKSLQLALESYYDANSNYPIASTEIDVASSTVLGALVTQGFIATLPDDPAANKNYRYVSDASGSEYCLGAALEGTVPSPADTCPSGTKVSGDTAGGSSNPVNYKVGQ